MNFLDEGHFFEASTLANEIAKETGERFSIPLEKVRSPSIKKFARLTQRVTFVEYEFGPTLNKTVLGSTAKVLGETIVTVNKNIMRERKAFTLMHEIMHVYCDIPNAKEGQTFTEFMDNGGYLPEDYEMENRANIGAGVLLLNDAALRLELLSRLTYEDISFRNSISKSALGFRISQFLTFNYNLSPDYAWSLTNNFKYNDGKKFKQAVRKIL